MRSPQGKPLYTEHKILSEHPMPARIHVCRRCRTHVLAFLGDGEASLYEPSERRRNPWCYRCGNSAQGDLYVRADLQTP